MVGIGTVLADDPMLNCRIEEGVDPVRIIVDSTLRTPLESNLVRTAHEIPTYIVCVRPDGAKEAALVAHGVNVVCLPDEKRERVDLTWLCQQIGEWGIDSVLLEGGGTLNGEMIRLGLVDRVQAYIAPKLIGGAGIPKMADALALDELTITRLGDDLLVEGRIRKD